MDIDENGDTIGELAYTGCVATSMAQIKTAAERISAFVRSL
jgi:hypothetical protein